MRLPRVRFTVERLMMVLVLLIAASLVVGSISGIRAEVAETVAVVFGWSYGAGIGFAVILAGRFVRRSPGIRLKPKRGVMAAIIVLTWATIDFPIVREWAYHAHCENLYRRDRAAEHDQVRRRELIALHLRLRRAYQDSVFRPWRNVTSK